MENINIQIQGGKVTVTISKTDGEHVLTFLDRDPGTAVRDALDFLRKDELKNTCLQCFVPLSYQEIQDGSGYCEACFSA